MPIKTIQPFISNFNAFAGEGFYGNVVQGLVIKQLEDTVFLFGIAIDGTLIFRKRNYPDVSTWEDPKIIIHSNNWHKIYSKRELGGLIGNTYSSFTLAKGEETLIATGTGVYYISNTYLDSVSSLIVINYDDPFILGEKDYRIKYRVQESKLYATALLGEEYVRVRNIAHK